MNSSTPDIITRAPVPDPSDTARISAIQRRIAGYYGITVSDLTGPSRAWAHAWPRNLAMFLCCRLTRASTTQIAAAFNRERSTISHANIHVLDICSAYPVMAMDVHRLEQDLAAHRVRPIRPIRPIQHAQHATPVPA